MPNELAYVRKLSLLLGWTELRRCRHTIKEAGSIDTVIMWYESGSLDDLLLQFNTQPSLCAEAFAMRFRICSGWHRVRFSRERKGLAQDVLILSDWLHRSWFESLEGRREYRRKHPECANYTWRRLRTEGPPHES